MSKRDRQEFDHKLYRKLARVIHEAFCEDEEWCNYGKPEPEELRYDESMTPEERMVRAAKRLEYMHHCQIAVDAENIAAHVTFGKGAKVRR